MAIIPSLELERISRRLAAEQGFGEEARLELLGSYLDFLDRAARSKEAAFPSREVDDIWHRHILDTRSYARDCSRWFGTFIHHQPDSEGAAVPGTRADCSAPEPEPPCRATAETAAQCGASLPKPVPQRRAPAGARADCSAQEPAPCKGLAATPLR